MIVLRLANVVEQNQTPGNMTSDQPPQFLTPFDFNSILIPARPIVLSSLYLPYCMFLFRFQG